MTIVPNGRQRGLDEQVRQIVDTYGIYEVVRSLANLARWRAHHHLSHGRQEVANLWQKASAALHWLNHQHIEALSSAPTAEKNGGA
jgi:hypothetical protein